MRGTRLQQRPRAASWQRLAVRALTVPAARSFLLLALLPVASAPARAAIQPETLTESTAQTGDSFGRRIAISGATMIVGMPADDDVAPDLGAAIIYTRTAAGW